MFDLQPFSSLNLRSHTVTRVTSCDLCAAINISVNVGGENLNVTFAQLQTRSHTSETEIIDTESTIDSSGVHFCSLLSLPSRLVPPQHSCYTYFTSL